jgi:hypothetical protein
VAQFFVDTFDEPGRGALGSPWRTLGGGWRVVDGNAVSSGMYSTAGRPMPPNSSVRHMRGVLGPVGYLYLFPFVSDAGALSVGVRVTPSQVALVNARRAVIAGTAAAVTAQPGDVVDITHDAAARRVAVSYNGELVAEHVYTIGDVSWYPYAAIGTGTVGAGWAAVSADDGQVAPPEPVPVPVSGRPLAEPCYGMNGTHWHEGTPWLTEDVPTVIEVDPTASAIRTAIRGVSDEQADAGTKILLRPGELTGLGGAESSTPVLDGMGSTTWRRNVLVAPRDGFGSVRIVGQSARFRKVHGVTFAQLDGVGITRTGCINNTLAWCRLQSHRTTGLNGQHTYNCNLYEVVVPDARVADIDPAGFASGYPGSPAVHTGGNAWLTDCAAVGCYSAPNWVPAGGIGHNDSWQLYGAGVYGQFELRDTALWGSNNCALQIGGWSAGFDALWPDMAYFVKLDHCLLVGPQSNSALRHAYLEGIKRPTLNQAINGAGRAGYLVSEGGTVIVGSVYPTDWASVTDTTVYPPPTRATVRSGAFTVDPALATLTPEQMDALSPRPTQDYLARIWGTIPTA